MNIKEVILKNAIKIPNWLNIILLKLNKYPQFVYGKQYHIYKNNLNNPKPILLFKVIEKATREVPYYRNKYQKLNINTITEFENVMSFIDRNIVMSNSDDFISETITKKYYSEITTGGTSGKPLRLLVPNNRYIIELATMHSMWQTTGWNYDVRAVIRNKKLPKGKFFIVNPITKEFIFDGFLTSDNEYMLIIYNTLKKYNIHYIHAYPSSAYQFCKFIKSNKLDASFIKAFFSGSENIFDYQKKFIEQKVGIRMYSWYGHSEKLILGGYCNKNDVYHIESTYGYFELVNENGKRVTTPGEFGEIVGTTLNNSGMPLIRYKTGDYAEYVGNYCPHCNRHVTLIKNITGRWNGERIYNTDNTFVTTTALNLHDDIYKVINGIQYIQTEKGKLEILIVKSEHFTKQHEVRLYSHFKSKVKPNTNILISYVDKLNKQPNGKFLQLISNINQK